MVKNVSSRSSLTDNESDVLNIILGNRGGIITAGEISSLTGLSESSVRKYVHNLRLKGFPICTDRPKKKVGGGGFYISYTKADIIKTIRSLKSRKKEIGKVVRALSGIVK